MRSSLRRLRAKRRSDERHDFENSRVWRIEIATPTRVVALRVGQAPRFRSRRWRGKEFWTVSANDLSLADRYLRRTIEYRFGRVEWAS